MTSHSADDIDTGSTSVRIVGCTIRARADCVEEQGSSSSRLAGFVANGGATTVLVLAGDGTASTETPAVLGGSAKRKDGDRDEGGELHGGVGWRLDFLRKSCRIAIHDND